MTTLAFRWGLAVLFGIGSALCLFIPMGRAAGPAEGQMAPPFSLEDSDGNVLDVAKAQGPLLILYFCDLDSKPNREGLLRLNRLAGAFKGSRLEIWAVSEASRERARHTESSLNLDYPILLDTQGVSERYGAQMILPMIYVMERGGKIIAVLSGTGKSTEEQLKKLVEARLESVPKNMGPAFEELKSKGIRAYDENRLEPASQYLTEALAIKPDRDCYLYLAHTWIEMEKYGKAEESLDAAIGLFPREGRFYETSVDFFLARNDPQRARSALQRGLKQLPDDPKLLAVKSKVDQAAREASTGAMARTMPVSPIKKTVETADQKARSLYNLARTENQKLTWDTCLAVKALQRAQSLARAGAFEHKDPTTGKNPAWDLVKTCHKAAFAGENLSRGEGQSSRVIHAAFMESSSHRKNILDTRFTLMGVGCHEMICVELFAGL